MFQRSIYNRIFFISIIITGDLIISSFQSIGSESLITKICMSGFKREMQQIGIIPPEGMDRFTCKCFANEFTKRRVIGSALSKCKKEAALRFTLPNQSI